MKIAVSGKGGVGKTTLAATLARIFSANGKKVLAIDADPDANLAGALGFERPKDIVPISEMKELIAERTGTEPGKYGSIFKMNPKVDDLPEKLAKDVGGLKFMVLGGVAKGGGGCVCPESVMLKMLIMHLVLGRDEVVIMDMEAGLEHLGRGTSQSVDKLLVVVEPGRRSLDTAESVRRLARDLKLKNVAVVGNKIRNESDKEFIRQGLTDFEILGFIPYNDDVIEADLTGRSAYDTSPATVTAVTEIYHRLIGR
ncbi:MAG: carbon monoxide dehydrogenase accessory protein CooC [Pseudomonadota bacterium]